VQLCDGSTDRDRHTENEPKENDWICVFISAVRKKRLRLKRTTGVLNGKTLKGVRYLIRTIFFVMTP
jgi:hypothetical protein